MISLKEFKEAPIVEEEKQDFSKFDALVRAGLANKTQLQRLHRILDKMQDEKPTFNSTDRALVQSLFNKMTDLITNNKQIFTKTRQAVREDVEEFTEAAKDPLTDPPFVLVLRRKAIRLYPNNQKVALYYNQKLNKSFTIPYGSNVDGAIQAENFTSDINTLEEDAITQLQKIKDEQQIGKVKHKDGTSSKVDVQTAHAILTVHKSLNDENKKKFADMVGKSNQHLQKASSFSFKHLK
jgi:phage gpG-like protein